VHHPRRSAGFVLPAQPCWSVSDLNVPLDGSVITDDGRIRAQLPTLQALPARLRQGWWSPSPRAAEGAPDQKYSLAPPATAAR